MVQYTYIVAIDGNIYYLHDGIVNSFEWYNGNPSQGYVRDTNFYLPQYMGGDTFVETANAQQIFEVLTQWEMEKFEKRAKDGVKFCHKSRSTLRMKFLYEEITEAELQNTNDALSEVRTQIYQGGWKKGLLLLEEAENLIDPTYYSFLHDEITNYISSEYDETILNQSAVSIIGNRPNDR